MARLVSLKRKIAHARGFARDYQCPFPERTLAQAVYVSVRVYVPRVHGAEGANQRICSMGKLNKNVSKRAAGYALNKLIAPISFETPWKEIFRALILYGEIQLRSNGVLMLLFQKVKLRLSPPIARRRKKNRTIPLLFSPLSN